MTNFVKQQETQQRIELYHCCTTSSLSVLKCRNNATTAVVTSKRRNRGSITRSSTMKVMMILLVLGMTGRTGNFKRVSLVVTGEVISTSYNDDADMASHYHPAAVTSSRTWNVDSDNDNNNDHGMKRKEFAKRQLWWSTVEDYTDDGDDDNNNEELYYYDESYITATDEEQTTTMSEGNVAGTRPFTKESSTTGSTTTTAGRVPGKTSTGPRRPGNKKSKNTKTMKHRNQCARMISDYMPAMPNLQSITRNSTTTEMVGEEAAAGSSAMLLADGSLVSTVSTNPSLPTAKCVSGNAQTVNGPFPCKDTDLLSFLNMRDLNEAYGHYDDNANDMWGWHDPGTGREFAIVGTVQATVFVEITNPTNPIIKGALPNINNAGTKTDSVWGDVKTYSHYAYIVTEAENQGLQIFNLRNLLTANSVKNKVYTETAHHNGFGNAHNIVINEDSGYAYAVGTDKCGGGMIMLDLNIDPLVPRQKACIRNTDGTLYGWHNDESKRYVYTHDAHCVNYKGPDTGTVSRGTELCFACNEDRIVIFDMSNKNSVKALGTMTYHNSGNTYTHQGWLTEDHKYFLFGDELDEYTSGGSRKTTTYIVDVRNLKSPTLVRAYQGPNYNIDHNLYIKGNYMYQANYRGGFHLFQLNDLSRGLIENKGYFDIFPRSDAARFNGAWSVYPFYPSGVVAVSGIEQGLFIFSTNDEPDALEEPSYVMYSRDTFTNSNWGIWNDGGANAKMESHDGERAIHLYGKTSTSRTYSNSLDNSATKLQGWRITVSICPRYMKNGHSLLIQVSSGSTTSWNTVHKFTKNSDHRNHGRYMIRQEVRKGTSYLSNNASNVRFQIKFEGAVLSDFVPIYEIRLHKWTL